MKKLSYLMMLILFVGFSCQEKAEEPILEACGVQNPVKELTWLAEKTASIESTGSSSPAFIRLAEYNEETIFLDGVCCASCNTVVRAYNCEGTLLGVVGPNSEINPSLILNERDFWKPRNFACLN
ncbi:hypothetical protein MMU07_03545 [Aquiflexum sp. LQ15W]|uniref:hypothetical protein n=1 Tax=Cognataquiflexum nitidum TaxID=2922272 RepID=UPI001F137E5B|nr:hypothetical protein [Cognataquiflexum nitidum]MCH6198640.1 hypothetical protein [Cognataquiflexum nitidum]